MSARDRYGLHWRRQRRLWCRLPVDNPVGRIEPDSDFLIGDSSSVVTPDAIRDTTVVVGAGEDRIEADGLAEVSDGAVHVSLIAVCNASVVVSDGSISRRIPTGWDDRCAAAHRHIRGKHVLASGPPR